MLDRCQSNQRHGLQKLTQVISSVRSLYLMSNAVRAKIEIYLDFPITSEKYIRVAFMSSTYQHSQLLITAHQTLYIMSNNDKSAAGIESKAIGSSTPTSPVFIVNDLLGTYLTLSNNNIAPNNDVVVSAHSSTSEDSQQVRLRAVLLSC